MDKKSKIYLLIVILAFFLALIGIYIAYTASTAIEFDVKFSSLPINSQKTIPKASLALQSPKNNYQVGETIPVKIILDTQNNPVDGVDVILVYPADNIEPQADNLLDKTNSVFANIIGPKTDAVKREIKFSALPLPHNSFVDRGEVATINFLAASTGQAEIKILFVKDSASESDSNVSYYLEAKDILSQATGLTIQIQ